MMDFYELFTCEMCGVCCRNNWLVTVDKTSYDRNAQLFERQGNNEEFRQAFIPLPAGTSPGEYAYIAKQAGGGCWFLAGDNLCRLQKQAGHQHLDNVCQLFPRYPMASARGVELTLSFSCPAVLRLVSSRTEPLAIIRTERPIALAENSYVLEVYPEQKSLGDPLLYYFELEHHFIDIMQARNLGIKARLDLICRTAEAVNRTTRDDSFARKLTKIINCNYDYLEGLSLVEQQGDHSLSDILLEHFFVNFIFKKPFYLYGLQRTGQILRQFWQSAVKNRKATQGPADDLERTMAAIRDLEFQYGHDRQKLLRS